MRHAVSLAAWLLVVAAPAAAFEIDMAKDAIRTAVGTHAVADLAVGEVGLVSSFVELCNQDGALMLHGGEPLLEQPQAYAWNLRIKREPNDRFAVTIEPAAGESGGVGATEIGREVFLTMLECSRARYPIEDFVQVSTVQGKDSTRQLLFP